MFYVRPYVHRHYWNHQNVEVPVSQLEKGLRQQMMPDGSSIEGFVRLKRALCTWYLTTIRLVFNWEDGYDTKTARLICDVISVDGLPFQGDLVATSSAFSNAWKTWLHILQHWARARIFLKLDEKASHHATQRQRWLL